MPTCPKCQHEWTDEGRAKGGHNKWKGVSASKRSRQMRRLRLQAARKPRFYAYLTQGGLQIVEARTKRLAFSKAVAIHGRGKVSQLRAATKEQVEAKKSR